MKADHTETTASFIGWNGIVEVEGFVGEWDHNSHLADVGEEPDYFAVYVRVRDKHAAIGLASWLADFPTRDAAEACASLLRLAWKSRNQWKEYPPERRRGE